MDMAELADRTGLPVRKLRYAFDHRVLPGLQGTSPGHGVPRTFTDFEGFGIALAAWLLDAGLTRKVVATVLDAACRSTVATRHPHDVPLYCAFNANTGSLEIGDGRYLRVRVPKRPGIIPRSVDTGWLSLASSEQVASDYMPLVCVNLDLGRLALVVQGHHR